MEKCSQGVCEPTLETRTRAVCPRCGNKGKKVETITVRYLVLGRYQDRVNEALSYHFCLSPECPVAYFSEEGDSIFTKEELSEKVTVKEKEDPLPLCYCFNFFRHDLEREIRERGRTTVPEFVNAQVKAGNCFCEYTNPQGSCCLGNINASVKALLKKAPL